MARTTRKPAQDDAAEDAKRNTVEGRLEYVLGVSGAGEMPIDMVFKTQPELDAALALLKKRKIKHIGAKLDNEKEKK